MTPGKTSATCLHRNDGKALGEASGKGLDYKTAGVDISAANAFVERIKPLCNATMRPEVIDSIGGFGGLFRLDSARYRNPILVSATDGVGTKLKLACELGIHGGIGIDLVAMCVNDVLTHGAEPLFFLDYLACGQLSADVATRVVAGIAEGCKTASCALIGGETAEMPGMYVANEYELAGFAVGVVENDALCGADRVRAGDTLIALASNGVHANGFSLIRHILDKSGTSLQQPFGETTLGEALLAPTHIYSPILLPAISREQIQIHAMAHITGGGLTENLPRILNSDQAATVELQSWARPPVFEWLREAGNIETQEMLRVFNCGVGMVAAVAPTDADALMQHIKNNGLDAWKLGEVSSRGDGPPVIYA